MCAAGVTRSATPDRRTFAKSETRKYAKTQSRRARNARAAPIFARWARRPRPVIPGEARWSGSVAVGPAAAGPDEGVAFAVLVVEEVGVDRRVEARIVQLDREIIAAFGGALRPGGPDFGPTDIDPMAGGVVVGSVGLGDDSDVLGLDAQGDDLALELAAGLLEGTDVGHVTSPLLF